MKTSVKRLVAVICCALLLGAAMAPSVFALDIFNSLGDIFGDDLDGILDDLFGNGNGETPALSLGNLFSNPGGILDSLRERLSENGINASNFSIASAIAAILNNESGFDLSAILNSNDFLNRLIAYFSDETSSTEPEEEPSEETEPSEESTTEAPSTSAPSTTLPPQTSYVPSTQPFTDTTADQNTSEPEYSYVEPSVEYTDPLTTVPFAPVYEEDYSQSEKGVTGKMIAGIAILIISAGAVVGVVVALKKTKV
ncbi:MAG: hypothetical protein J1E34_02400 [Oscillospiraceae bacterium]|nr:hypothetical protein [Oscillospiraceae bacterium]